MAGRLARHHAGIKMSRATTTPADLARTITENLRTEVNYPPIPIDGAQRIADILLDTVEQPRENSRSDPTRIRLRPRRRRH